MIEKAFDVPEAAEVGGLVRSCSIKLDALNTFSHGKFDTFGFFAKIKRHEFLTRPPRAHSSRGRIYFENSNRKRTFSFSFLFFICSGNSSGQTCGVTVGEKTRGGKNKTTALDSGAKSGIRAGETTPGARCSVTGRAATWMRDTGRRLLRRD